MKFGSRPNLRIWKGHNTFAYDRRGNPIGRIGIKGQADITGILYGYRLEIEVKVKKDSLKPEQRNFLEMILNNGGCAFEARCLDDVEQRISEFLRQRAVDITV